MESNNQIFSQKSDWRKIFAVDTSTEIRIDTPTFIRMLEFAKEDAKTDMQLHVATERINAMHGKLVTMEDYDKIVKGLK